MGQQKNTDTSKLKFHYGLALEEIKLERSISNMANALDKLQLNKKPQYLINEMAVQQQQLHSLRKLRLA